MKNYLLKIAYDGTSFGGWQVQPNAETVQEKLQNALLILLKKETHVTGQGRTDAGVHALSQTAHFQTDVDLDLRKFLKSLNALLPETIRVTEISEVPLDFHARFSTKGKIYHYFITTDPVILPFDRHYRWHHIGKLDLDAIRRAATYFVGTHDFTSFSNEAHRGSCKHDPVRTMKRVDIIEEPGGFRVEMEADGFLYKMCRNIVGTLVACGKHRIEASHIPNIFASKDRSKAEQAAPPEGLFLIHVIY
jgi:tRNA pseudouridine38-40 synthase